MPSFTGMARSRTSVVVHGERQAGDQSSSPAKVPHLPPMTPTRTLLRRIQRRSSTSAEAVHSMAAAPLPMSKASTMTMTMTGSMHRRMPPQTSTPLHRRSLQQTRPSALQRKSSTASMASVTPHVAGHIRTPSNATVKTAVTIRGNRTPSQSKPEPESALGRSSTDLAANHIEGDVAEARSPGNMAASTTMPEVAVAILPCVQARRIATEPKKRYSMVERTTVLRQAGTQGQGLTQDAAMALEQEFTEQERILQGLQRDNERKTTEVEELRRQKARLEDFCARHFGQDDWREMVFGAPNRSAETSSKGSLESSSPRKAEDELKDLSDASSSSQAIVEGLLKTLQSPHRRPGSLIPFDNVHCLSVDQSSNDSSNCPETSFASAAAAPSSEASVYTEKDAVTVPRSLIEALAETQKALLTALSQT